MVSILSFRRSPVAVMLLFLCASCAEADDAQHAIEAGRAQFTRVRELTTTQVGRTQDAERFFNATSCAECHKLGGIGGAGPNRNNVQLLNTTPTTVDRRAALTVDLRASKISTKERGPLGPGRGIAADSLAAARDRFVPISNDGVIMLHRHSTSPDYAAYRAAVVEQVGSGGLEERNTPPLFGLGLIDKIPQSAIDEIALSQPPKIKGRSPRLKTGGYGRFGWKAQTATLADFNEGACAAELGLKTAKFSPAERVRFRTRGPGARFVSFPAQPALDMTADEIAALTTYVAALPPPEQASLPAMESHVREGEALFHRAGCAACHVPNVGGVKGVYSDLLLHEIGTAGTVIYYGSPIGPQPESWDVVRGTEMRTPPLWGLADSAPYLHDGSAATIEEAINRHSWQALRSMQVFRTEFTDASRRKVITFLNSLRAPGAVAQKN